MTTQNTNKNTNSSASTTSAQVSTNNTKEENVMNTNEMNTQVSTNIAKEEMNMNIQDNASAQYAGNKHPLIGVIADMIRYATKGSLNVVNALAADEASGFMYELDTIYNDGYATEHQREMLEYVEKQLEELTAILMQEYSSPEYAWTVSLDTPETYAWLEVAGITVEERYVASNSTTVVILRTLYDSVSQCIDMLHEADMLTELAAGDEEPFDDPVVNYNNNVRSNNEYTKQWMEDAAIDSNAVDINNNNSKEVSIMRTNENKHIDMSNTPINVLEAIDKAMYVSDDFESVYMEWPSAYAVLCVNNDHVATLPFNDCIVQASTCRGDVKSLGSGAVLISFNSDANSKDEAVIGYESWTRDALSRWTLDELIAYVKNDMEIEDADKYSKEDLEDIVYTNTHYV